MLKEQRAARRKANRSPVGSAPGTLTAHPQAEPTTLNLTLIGHGRSEFLENVDFDTVAKRRNEFPLVWLDCVGLGNVDLIERVGKLFGLHRLALEDAVNTGQRPKADFYDAHGFIVLSMIDEIKSGRVEQISVAFGKTFVVTLQERKGDPFEPVRHRIRRNSPICERGGDYLAYTLIDAIVDSYFPVLEGMGDLIDKMEDAVFGESGKDRRIKELHMLRRGVSGVKRSLWPLRDALAGLARTDNPLMTAETKLYFNDTLDHAIRLIEMVETYRDMLSGLIEVDLSMAQARTSDVISFLTIISSIFIPLTFVAGVWGMNFDPQASPFNMPELETYYGYPFALLFMVTLAGSIFAYFKWKKWL
ncbi:MAG: magnesium/cobalt transporter CorA [Methylobacterium mesophilicum]|nr:magnesium/cobalt transporter CorA [Methylobacterium mesophilicum]